MSGIRQSAGIPFTARISKLAFARWAKRETGSDSFAAIGANSLVCPPAMIRGHEAISIGDEVIVHPGSIISCVADHEGTAYQPRLEIGNRVRIGCDMVIACCGEISIGDDVLGSDRVFIGDTYHAYRDPERPIIAQGLADPRPVRIEAGAFLGINCAVMPGVTIGEGACVAANAVVTKDVPARSMVAGNPARVIREWNGERWVDRDHSR